MLSHGLQLQVGGIQPHQRLTALNGLASINKAFKDLTLHSKTKIALRSCHHHAGIGARGIVREFYGCGSDERRLGARIVTRGVITAGHEGQRQKTSGKAG
ncbi:hypothetical protein TUM17563_39050 [Klebsiella oxytoca]|nr:hypothetical protein TUM17563_39050 [Klebsiella oxytoca]GKQ21429.1 hypothetical protein NUBL21980_46460 [Klebsiella michiganensis]